MNTFYKPAVLLALSVASVITSHAQFFDKHTMDSLNRLSYIDHADMMKQLGIDSLRPGADPNNNPNATNAVNWDESKADQHPTLPNPLVLNNGRPVTSADMWWHQRRPQIAEFFDREVYGRVPAHVPAVTWKVISTTREMNGDVAVITKQLIGHADNSADTSIHADIQLTVSTPADAKKPVPVMMELQFVFPKTFKFPPQAFDTLPNGKPAPNWQQQLLAKGWGYAAIIPTSFQADNGAGLTSGIIGLTNKGERRKPDDWGTLRAWAWGVSRAIDYFETDKDVDAKRVGIEGHSRFGKAALVAMAYDPRVAIGFISSSGEGGAKLHRHDIGERVENLTGSGEYHWMAGNFIKYGGPLHPNDLPVDAHELIDLCAPRPIFISCGNKGDEWTDMHGMFMAAVAAGPVYDLLGKKDLGTTEMPPVNTTLIDGDIAWRQHNYGHTPAPNWATFITFAGRYFNKK